MDMTFRLPFLRHLLVRDFYLNRKSLLILSAVLVGLLTLFGIMAKLDNTPITPAFHLTWYGIFFFVLGIFHTGGVYSEFAQPATRQDYLLLPASTLEKWTSRWLRTLPIYLLAFTFLYWVASWVLNLVCYLGWGEIHSIFQPLQSSIWEYWQVYIVAHAVFLIGAIHFNKAATIKTALSLLIIQAALSFIIGVAAWLIFQSWSVDDNMIQSSFGFNLSEQADFWLGKVGKIVLWIVLVPFFWWVSFLKLKEKEA